MEDFVLIPLQPDTATISFVTGKGVLCVVMVCHNCGNTIFINVVTLGVPEIIAEKRAMERARAEKQAEAKAVEHQG